MVPPPPNLRRIFLSWEQPLLPQAVALLSGDWNGSGPLDLAHLLVVVPTTHSGRRLREALAAQAAEKGQAAFPPRVVTPDRLLAADDTAGVASRLESLLAWVTVFRGIDLENFRDVFPVDPPDRSFAWALRLARDFARLQQVLAETGLRLADVPTRVGNNFPETERWMQIAELERRYVRKLADLGLLDDRAAQIVRARAPVLPEGITRVVVLAVPDPLPLALEALAVHARKFPVDVVVFALESDAAAFDAWGRPLTENWATRELVLADFEQRVQLCADSAAQAERLVALSRDYRDDEGAFAVGVADAEVLPLLETGLRHVGMAAFNPEGRTRREEGLYQLLAALAGLARDDSFDAVATIARCPDFLAFLAARIGENFSAAEFLQRLDAAHTAYLPSDLNETRRHLPQSAELDAIAEIRSHLTKGTFPENAATALETIFSGRRFDLARPDEALAKDAADACATVMREIATAAEKFRGVDDVDWWDVALRLFGDERRPEDKAPGAIEMQGWLELLWEDAPHLAVAGFNDGIVPDVVVGDAFLPESFRVQLGLKTNAVRFARDHYILQAIAACREHGGRLDLFLGKTSVAGDPLRPSRLLLRCPEAELPRRVDFLFRPAEAARPNPPWQRAWRLQPGRIVPPTQVAVTSLRAWLECPFRFYLSRVLKMQPVDPAKTELDEFDFGILCHAALEAMGAAPALRDCTEAKTIREFLLGTLDQVAMKRFGSELTLPLLVQLESARQRLTRVAEVQAQSRAEGWVTTHVERPFEINVAGLTVRGKIDRIDRHEVTGAIRVLDYKTSDRPVNPEDAHLRSARRDETAREFARFVDGDRERVWCDLQLPLYLHALAKEFSGEISCGYFNLPKAVTTTGIARWENYTRELAESARRCAEGVASAIRAGEFWPPNETIRPRQDDFATLFHGGVAESVAWEERTR